MPDVRIAIVDNGVDEVFLKKPLEYKVLITEDGDCIPDNSDMEHVSFLHGTTCAQIIEKYFPEGNLSSVKVLDEKGTGLLTKLLPAMEWCLQNQINILNVSLGSMHFQDRDQIRTLINEYAVKGLIVIAATANSGYVSYPAALSHVIGVAIDRDAYNDFTGNGHLGIDVLVPGEQELISGEKKITAQKSNSYAAPYITALIGKLAMEKPMINIYIAKLALASIIEEHKVYLSPVYEEPDWIHNALIKTTGRKSRAEYYFNAVDEKAVEEMRHADVIHSIDTVVIDDLSKVEGGSFNNKNIIYLGKEKVKQPNTNKFFWSSENRLKQILNREHIEIEAEMEHELKIPVILCEWKDEIDEMFLLSQLKKSFGKGGYYLYTISFCAESVLYDLEYIPEEVLEEKYISSLYRFIYWQTHYKQNDAVLIGSPLYFGKQKLCLQDKIDLKITLERCEIGYRTLFLYEDIAVGDVRSPEIDTEYIQTIFRKIREVLGE